MKAGLEPKKIFCGPGIPWGRLFETSPDRLPEPLGHDGLRFFLRGSTALWQGIRQLNLCAGQGILFPAYHCGVELDVLLQAGLNVVFYGVDHRLQIDPGQLQRLAGPKTRALYVIHYFGLPHPVERLSRLCAANGWHLIEDCAQALFTRCNGLQAGTSGDIGIFSLHKFLPLPSCGALISKKTDVSRSRVACRKPPPGFVARQTIDLLGRDLVAMRVMNTSQALRFRKTVSEWIRTATASGVEKMALLSATGPRTFIPQWRDAAAPRLSRQLLGRLPVGDVVGLRRRNFSVLLQAVDGCRRLRPLFETLPEGACPLFFPVVIPGDADSFVAFCRQRGVVAHPIWRGIHPAFPRERFAPAAWLRDHVVAIPVHQGLRGHDLVLLTALLRDWEGGTMSQDRGILNDA